MGKSLNAIKKLIVGNWKSNCGDMKFEITIDRIIGVVHKVEIYHPIRLTNTNFKIWLIDIPDEVFGQFFIHQLTPKKLVLYAFGTIHSKVIENGKLVGAGRVYTLNRITA